MADNNSKDGHACSGHDPEIVFKHFRLVEFPKSYVNLKSILDVSLDVSLGSSAILKTFYQGQLMKFEEAQQISAAHAAFTVEPISDHSLRITFVPTSHCITKAKKDPTFDDEFICDLRLLKIDGTVCCENENHWEIGRIYISGQVEFPKISHAPAIVDFGHVLMYSKAKQYVTVTNKSSVAAKFQHLKRYGFEVTPSKCILSPNSSRRLRLTIEPTTLKAACTMIFKVMNPSHTHVCDEESNYIAYPIRVSAKIIYNRVVPPKPVESQHLIYDKDYNYAFTDEEMRHFLESRGVALHFLEEAKSLRKKPHLDDPYPYKLEYYHEESVKRNPADFCKPLKPEFTLFDVTNVIFTPWSIDFGKIGIGTYGEETVSIENKTEFKVTILFCRHQIVRYTKERHTKFKIAIPPESEYKVGILCLGTNEGKYDESFEYILQNKISRRFPFQIIVEPPKLILSETALKFGMVTNENFLVSVPIRLSNDFNVPVDFKWQDLDADIPYEVIPKSGTIAKHSSRICDIMLLRKFTKCKNHKVNFFSKSTTTEVISVELTLVRRKILMKFLQPSITFKDIPLNLPIHENVTLENSSREIVHFYVVDPSLPGLEIEPMNGIMLPKSLIIFDINLKLPCILEFAIDIIVRVNNKENIYLSIDGNVVEPKISILPKNLIIPRIPAFLYTFIPITLHNIGAAKTFIEVIHPNDGCIFDLYYDVRGEKIQFTELTLEAGHSKVVFIKVYDCYRREYEMYLPLKINGSIGPTTRNLGPLDLQYYTRDYEEIYANHNKIKLRSSNKEICYCRLIGVITLPWLNISVDEFCIDYQPNSENTIDFQISNVSKHFFPITIVITKISPNFTLTLMSEEENQVVTENSIKFFLNSDSEALFKLEFHPKGHGRFVAVAPLYLDKAMSVNYSNLTFIGKRLVPVMTPSCRYIIFPVCHVGESVSRQLYLTLEDKAKLQSFSYAMKDDANIKVKFISLEAMDNAESTVIAVLVTAFSSKATPCTGRDLVSFHNENGATCEIEICYSFATCPITLHANRKVDCSENPYPFFPLPDQCQYFNYMDNCVKFLERWMFFQGFRKEFYPSIAETFHSISENMVILPQGPSSKPKGINISYLNFIRRIAGPLVKNIKKIKFIHMEEPFKTVSEVYGTYKEIIKLLKSRGSGIWGLDPKYLLSFRQYKIYTNHVTLKNNAEIQLMERLLGSRELYNRLSKQCWMDLILQTYKVFVVENCFFACICSHGGTRDIINTLLEWFNTLTIASHTRLRNEQPYRRISNLTTDLQDGIALASALIHYCPFLLEQFSGFCELENEDSESVIINNACLIIESLNIIRINFPLCSKDFLQPNYLQFLFLSIHLYITLPMFIPREVIYFNPPILQRSCRNLTLTNQETLMSHLIILNNNKNSFSVERLSDCESGKKVCLAVKYRANFIQEQSAVLLVQGYSKARLFDTFVIFQLHGEVSTLVPYKKCKVFGCMYQQTRVDVLIPSPFSSIATFTLTLMDTEPKIPLEFPKKRSGFYIQRLHLVETEVSLKEVNVFNSDDVDRIRFHLICMSAQVGNSWVWFKSDIGEFFIKITTQPRWDLAHETLQIGYEWPADPCACGEECECYRTTVVRIPHKLEAKENALKQAMSLYVSPLLMGIYDRLIESPVGRIVLKILIAEAGTDMSEVEHILDKKVSYTISSRTLEPRLSKVTLSQYSNAFFTLAVTMPAKDKSEKHTLTLHSECGLDIRNYKIMFVQDQAENKSPVSSV